MNISCAPINCSHSLPAVKPDRKAPGMQSTNLTKVETSPTECGDLDLMPPQHTHATGRTIRSSSHVGIEFDYESAARTLHYGRRMYPTFDPSHTQSCPLRFVRQFEHAAQHNGLHLKAWARRFNSCLHGKAEDWAFDECPLETTGLSWEVRCRQFLDWALLPAEQELRRQRLLRFYQAETDLSIDFVYSFEEASRGLRDYKENVWVRKCIANMVAPIRTALFELWPDGLPVRFRDLRDSLYAVDWNLYEAASVPLKVFKYGSPYVYETYNARTTFAHALPSRTSMAGERPAAQQLLHAATASRPSISISVNRKYSSTVSSPDPLSVAVAKKKRNGINTAAQNRGALSSVVAGSLSPRVSSEAASNNAFIDTCRPSTTHTTVPNMGLFELINTLGQISDRERGIIMSALEKIGTVPEDESPAFSTGENTCAGQTQAQAQTQRSDIYSGTLNSTTAAVVRQGTIKGGQNSRAATAATIAATAQLYVDTGNCGGGGAVDNSTRCLNTTSNRSSPNDDFGAMSGVPGVRQRPTIVMRASNDSDEQHQPVDMIRLRTRPLTTMACSSRPLSNIFTSADVRMSMTKQPINLPSTTTPLFAQVQEAAAAAAAEEQARLTHARKLSNRKSDSALTTATRSMRAAENLYYCDSVDNELRSPEFTIIHPAIDLRTSARRGRFAFIKKISHMLTPH